MNIRAGRELIIAGCVALTLFGAQYGWVLTS